MPKNISVQELKDKLDNDESFVLLDCREEDEFHYCKIDGAKLIPLSRFQQQALQELQEDQEIVIYCHHGMRSLQAGSFLEHHGFQNVWNVVGGIEAWSLEIDSKVPRY